MSTLRTKSDKANIQECVTTLGSLDSLTTFVSVFAFVTVTFL